MNSYDRLKTRTDAEKRVLIAALDLAADKHSVAKQATLHVALGDLDAERSGSVLYAISKTLTVSKNVLTMTPEELQKSILGNRTGSLLQTDATPVDPERFAGIQKIQKGKG